MRNEVLKIEKVSKQYRLGLVGTGTLSHDINRWWHRVRGKNDPYLKVGEENNREVVGGDYVWALQDIDFSVERGDVVGVIGKNGAGKSTLLKLLSQVTNPTLGEIKIKGKISSLLEVGTGFHPELTGRENVFLNGAILGMTKGEISSKFDEIIEFSGVDKYIDTPVKRYSSGMLVRLGFAVAAHLEPDILIVDEVLAVGDSEFQKKCLGKMKSVAGEGRTILFVSHNIQAVANLCNKGVLLENGKMTYFGGIEDCIKKYITSSRSVSLDKVSMKDRLSRTSGNALFVKAQPIKNNKESWEFDFNEPIDFDIVVEVREKIPSLLIYFALKNSFSGEIITNYKHVISENEISDKKQITLKLQLPASIIKPNQYSVYLALGSADAKTFYDVLDNNVNFPLLNVNPVSMDVHENSGYFTAPFKINIDSD